VHSAPSADPKPDISAPAVLDALRGIAPLHAVCANCLSSNAAGEIKRAGEDLPAISSAKRRRFYHFRNAIDSDPGPGTLAEGAGACGHASSPASSRVRVSSSRARLGLREPLVEVRSCHRARTRLAFTRMAC